MKIKYITFVFLFFIYCLLFSCKKETQEEMIEEENTESYFPLTSGSTWTYTDQSGNLTTIALTYQTEAIEGNSWKVIKYTPQQPDNPTHIRLDEVSQIVYRAYDFRSTKGFFLIEPIADLDGKLLDLFLIDKVSDRSFFKSKSFLSNRRATKVINGKSYDNVMIVENEMISNIVDSQNSTFYYVRGVGMIAQEFQGNRGNFFYLVDYTIE